MSLESKYQPSQETIARFVEFVERHETVRTDRVVPTVEQLGQLVETVFWASLAEEEGHLVHPAIKLFGPNLSTFNFAKPERLEPTRLAKLSPSLFPGMYFGVSLVGGEPEIWGIGQGLSSDIAVEAIAPGIVVLEYMCPFAVFRRERVEIVKPSLQETAMAPIRRAVTSEKHAETLLGLVRVMRVLRRGGTLVVVPEREGEWRKDVELSLESNPPFGRLSHSITKYQEGLLADNANCHAEAARRGLWKLGENALSWAREEESAAEAVAQLTTVDGAVFVDRDLKVISFGAKLVAPNIEEQVTCWSPVENVDVIKRALDKIGGTRHQSAVRFVAKTRNALAIVVSQDGPVSIITWDERNSEISVTRNAELLIYGRWRP